MTQPPASTDEQLSWLGEHIRNLTGISMAVFALGSLFVTRAMPDKWSFGLFIVLVLIVRIVSLHLWLLLTLAVGRLVPPNVASPSSDQPFMNAFSTTWLKHKFELSLALIAIQLSLLWVGFHFLRPLLP